MQKGFPTKTLGIVAAALLSGSVFAAGPTISDLPTVIITDKMNAADIAAAPAGDVYDYRTNATQNIYQFSAAFQLDDYVGYTGDMNNVRYLFTESDPGVGGALRTGAARTLYIDETPGYETSIVPTLADVRAGSIVGLNQNLDFRNDARSPLPLVWTPGTQPTFTDEALVTMFVASTQTGEDDIAAKAFTVFTTNNAGYAADSLAVSGATNVFAFEECFDTLGGWTGVTLTEFFKFNQIPQAAGWLAGSTRATLLPTPTGTPMETSAAGTTALTYQSAGDPAGIPGDIAGFECQFGYWQSMHPLVDPNANVVATVADMVYLVRWTVTTPKIASQVLEPIRFRMGASDTSTIGSITDEINRGPNHIYNPGRTHRSWFYSHAAGSMMFALDGVDLTTDDAGLDITLSKVEVFSLTRASLSGETVVLNEGGAAVTLASGQAAPPSTSLVGFDTTSRWTYQNLCATLGHPEYRVISTSGTGASRLVVDAPTPVADGNTLVTWDMTRAAEISGVEASGEIPNTKLLFMDAWIQSPTAATTNNTLPTVRIGLFAGPYGSSGALTPATVFQGRSVYFSFDADNANAGNLLALQTAARRYTVIAEPWGVASASVAFRPSINVLFYDNLSVVTALPHGTDAGTIQIERVALTTYDVPANAATVLPGACP